ncbi:MAG TPA: VanZ family protein [Thermoanaerobaculia bacterium]|nr:VanZ family protein [Thermoanaerobaculia bacterium]
MGKREVRVIVVRKRVTVALLILVSVAMLSLIGFLSGRTYSSELRGPAEELVTLLQVRSPTDTHLIAAGMPLVADVLAFLPWGFLAFVALDTKGRRRFRSYLWTCAAAVAFALALVWWQYLLPTRVTTFGDTIFNLAGALIGASLGHLRRTVRIQFS